MNKKGFTLIEVLACITIIGIIACMASININSAWSLKNKEENTNKENIITSAACVYIELDKNKDLKSECLSKGCDISTDTLIKEDLLMSSDVDKLRVIHIEMINNEKKCIIKED